jgi:PAS domain S-box-containing protein
VVVHQERGRPRALGIALLATALVTALVTSLVTWVGLVLVGHPRQSSTPLPRSTGPLVTTVTPMTGSTEFAMTGRTQGAIDHALLSHAVDRAPDGVVIVDGDGIIHYANDSMSELVGRPDGSLLGRSVDELVPDTVRAHHADLRASYNSAPSQRPMGSGLDLQLRRVDGSLVPVEISLSPLVHDGQRFVIAAVRDVTERNENQRRLAAANAKLTLLDERERIGRDLHDVVLQHLYGVGLSVQATAIRADADVTHRLEQVVDEIDRIISEVRTIVFTLGTATGRGPFGQELADVIAQASRVLGFTPGVRLEGPVESVISDDIRSELVATMREALGNVARHAQATQAHVRVGLDEGNVTMSVVDNGVGPPPTSGRSGGHGLPNLRARAESLGGRCELRTSEGGGAELWWSVPFDLRP